MSNDFIQVRSHAKVYKTKDAYGELKYFQLFESFEH